MIAAGIEAAASYYHQILVHLYKYSTDLTFSETYVPGTLYDDSYHTSTGARVQTNTKLGASFQARAAKPWPRLRPSGTHRNNLHVG